MNYFELINKCLVELNYKKVRNFSELIKNDHLKIMNILNIINSEICTFDNWNFLLRKASLVLPANSNEIENPINGRINTLQIANKKIEYSANFESFLLNQQVSDTYSVLNDNLLFQKYPQEKTIDVVYYTNNFVKKADGTEALTFSEETDQSQIPLPFAEPLLVYGTCLRLKGNPNYSKFNYWYGMYRDNLATLRAKVNPSADQTPTITLKRS